jgi:hypothetical protein
MSGDTDNPRIWINADVLVAPVGTTAPTNLTGAWNVAFEALGLLSEDGMTEARDADVTDHFAWGGIHIRTTRSKFKRTFVVTALEDNPVVFDLVNPGSEASTTGGVTTRTVKVPESDPRAFGFELVDGAITTRRIIPRGEVTAVAEVKSSDSDMTMYQLTITVYADADGVLYTDITNDPQAETGS